MDEIMTGTHCFTPGFGPEGYYSMEFKISWGPEKFFEWANPKGEKFLTQPLEGLITIDGVCKSHPCKGTLELKYFEGNYLQYSIDFAVGGKPFKYIGRKVNIKPWNLPVSHTTCYGKLFDCNDNLISRSITYFRFRTIPKFLVSLRLE